MKTFDNITVEYVRILILLTGGPARPGRWAQHAHWRAHPQMRRQHDTRTGTGTGPRRGSSGRRQQPSVAAALPFRHAATSARGGGRGDSADGRDRRDDRREPPGSCGGGGREGLDGKGTRGGRQAGVHHRAAATVAQGRWGEGAAARPPQATGGAAVSGNGSGGASGATGRGHLSAPKARLKLGTPRWRVWHCGVDFAPGWTAPAAWQQLMLLVHASDHKKQAASTPPPPRPCSTSLGYASPPPLCSPPSLSKAAPPPWRSLTRHSTVVHRSTFFIAVHSPRRLRLCTYRVGR